LQKQLNKTTPERRQNTRSVGLSSKFELPRIFEMSGVWNETEPNGGNSLTDSAYINSQYTTGDIAWITFAAAIVWIMIPGIG
jgi:uncharacterized protein with LGFP repeats